MCRLHKEKILKEVGNIEQQVAHVWSLERGQAQAGFARERLCSRRVWQIGGECVIM